MRAMRRMCGNCRLWAGDAERTRVSGCNTPLRLGVCAASGERRERCSFCDVSAKERAKLVKEDEARCAG